MDSLILFQFIQRQLTSLTCIGIVQVLRFDFEKFRILEILNFHPLMVTIHWLDEKQCGP